MKKLILLLAWLAASHLNAHSSEVAENPSDDVVLDEGASSEILSAISGALSSVKRALPGIARAAAPVAGVAIDVVAATKFGVPLGATSQLVSGLTSSLSQPDQRRLLSTPDNELTMSELQMKRQIQQQLDEATRRVAQGVVASREGGEELAEQIREDTDRRYPAGRPSSTPYHQRTAFTEGQGFDPRSTYSQGQGGTDTRGADRLAEDARRRDADARRAELIRASGRGGLQNPMASGAFARYGQPASRQIAPPPPVLRHTDEAEDEPPPHPAKVKKAAKKPPPAPAEDEQEEESEDEAAE